MLIVLFYLSTPAISQTEIQGRISENKDTPLAYVSVVLKDSLSKSTVAYSYTDEKGDYILQTKAQGHFYLIASSLGFESDTVLLELTLGQQLITKNIVLKPKSIELNTVILHGESPITVKKDTINFKTVFFTDGTEQVVEDLLKKIPGLQIDSNGKINVGGQEIEKLMIDGDDFFEKGYTILSKNMPAHPIKEVEILKKYSSNKLLKGIEESDKVALNLKIDKKFERIWFGNIEASLGNDDFHQFRANLMNFGKQNKYYFLFNSDNIGYDATGDIQELISPINIESTGDFGENQRLNSLIYLQPPSSLGFSENRTRFNNSKLISLNAIFNPTEKLKIKPILLLNNDSNDFYRNGVEIVHTEDLYFTNTESFKLRNRKQIAFGKIDISYEISKNKVLEAAIQYNEGDYKDTSELLFNEKLIKENLEHQNQYLHQKIKYTNKFRNNKVFILTGKYIQEKSPQDYTNNQFIFEDLFPELQNANKVAQAISNRMQFAGVEAQLLDRRKNGDLLEILLANEFRKDRLLTSFSILEEEVNLVYPEGFQNQTNYLTNDLYLKSRFRKKINTIGISGGVTFNQLYNRLENQDKTTQQNKLFVTPNLRFSWEINENNQFLASYSYNMTNADALDVYNNFILNGYRSFIKGDGELRQLNSSSIIFNYKLGNWGNRFFINSQIMLNKNHDFYSSNAIISQNYILNEKTLIKNREFLAASTTIDYFLNFINSNLKLDLGYFQTDFKNIINNSDWREVRSTSYTYGLELRSGFKGFFNFHFGTKLTKSRVRTTLKNSFTDNKSFLDLDFVFNNKFNLHLQSEFYHFSNQNSSKDIYSFLDFNAQYRLIENKLTLSLLGKNLFNTKKLINSSVNDIGTFTAEHRLLPIHVLLKMEYRF